MKGGKELELCQHRSYTLRNTIRSNEMGRRGGASGQFVRVHYINSALVGKKRKKHDWIIKLKTKINTMRNANHFREDLLLTEFGRRLPHWDLACLLYYVLVVWNALLQALV